MAAKGSIAKTEVFKKMNKDFPNSFLFNGGKELRINWEENGEPIQIKVTLTYVKEPVLDAASEAGQTVAAPTLVNDLTEDEKKRLATLVAAVY